MKRHYISSEDFAYVAELSLETNEEIKDTRWM